jgi:phage recombination protein Bet
MNANALEISPPLPSPVARRGITEFQWRTLMNNLFPGAKAESVVMVWDYCKARNLDPMKKPCHIVPMQIKDQNGDYIWRDVVMPGIYEYRTTANRTGEYMGHSQPSYGPEIEHMGVKAPEWCAITIFRYNKASGQRCEFPVVVYFSEVAATTWDKKAGEHKINARWTKAPRQMLTKCTEAAGLREGFPDEIGGEATADEMEGREIIDITPPRIDPRGDTSDVDWELRDRHVEEIRKLVDEFGSDDAKLAPILKDYVQTRLNQFQELYIVVMDKLDADSVITKAHFKRLVK